ncbi:transcription factor E2F6 isoform X2 [Scleropages formosus]|uniref:transcription factor E2F6 isoform X2 n=1 Tax=Scleropages formosus TaxID=113540 RepID=UPI0008785918|nr:transcription factor E2F6-like isoform X2 [Scleropages formosus]
MVKCVVQGCPNKICPESDLKNRPHKRFFSFPKDEARVKVWLAALRETERVLPSEEHRICEDHFLKDHITQQGVSEDAIPIMPPYLDGPLALAAETEMPSCEELGELSEVEDLQNEFDEGRDGEDETWETEGGDCFEDDPENKLSRAKEENDTKDSISRTPRNPNRVPSFRKKYRCDVSLGRLTKRFMELVHAAPDGILDLNEAARQLGARKRRVYDVTNVLSGIQLIKKRSTSQVQWVGSGQGNELCNQWEKRLKEELLNLTAMEEALDELIKDCAHQLFSLTDHKDNADLAYVTHDDICRIKAFQDQVVIAIRAPEGTKLEVPAPKEDSIQIRLKSTRGPIKVLLSETDGPCRGRNFGAVLAGTFFTLENSRIRVTPLIADGAPQ